MDKSNCPLSSLKWMARFPSGEFRETTDVEQAEKSAIAAMAIATYREAFFIVAFIPNYLIYRMLSFKSSSIFSLELDKRGVLC